MVIYRIYIYQYMIGIHGEYGNTQLLIYIYIYEYTTKIKKLIHVLHSHISLFGHGLISMFLNVCKLLAGACMMTSHTGLAGTGCDDVIFC
jgi:hypothetical protein